MINSLPAQGFRLHLRRLLAAGVCATLAVLTAGPALTQSAAAATAVPAAPAGLPAGIEQLADYVPANSCSPTTKPGAAKLGRLLTTTYPGTTFGGARGCGALPDSEHHDGRAVDWMTNIRDKKQAAQAKAVISWLLATDEDGNAYANARRLGVMYIIWNNKIWGAYSADRGWRAYSTCADQPSRGWDNTCHRNHMHISLSWAGAMGDTSFWSDEVAAPDFGRCRPKDLNWAYGYKAPNPNRCDRYPKVTAPKGASTLLKTLTTYSGRHLKLGSKGAPVKAVQQALKITAGGTYGASTVAAVKKWQAARDLPITGTVNHTTWRALLKTNAPASGS